MDPLNKSTPGWYRVTQELSLESSTDTSQNEASYATALRLWVYLLYRYRMRSSTAIPPPLDVPFKLGDKLRQPTVQTTMAASHSPKLSRRKPRSETVSVLDSNKSSWVTRYQPGVLLLSGSMRECLIQRKLQESENEFCEQKKLKWVNNLVPRLWPHPVSVRGIHCWRILCVQCNRLCVNCSTHS